MDNTLIRTLVDLRDRTLQKSRIAFSNRMSAIESGRDVVDESTRQTIEEWLKRLEDLEKLADGNIVDFGKGVEIIERLTAVKGISYILAAKLVSMIDIKRAETVSALWRYAGYGVTNGERDKPTKGEKLIYNKRLKATCYLIGSSFLRSSSPYRSVYDDARIYYEANRPDWTKLHQHNAAMRKMIKVFLSHTWEIWRSIEGLPIRPLYVQERLNHNHYMKPQDFGWESN